MKIKMSVDKPRTSLYGKLNVKSLHPEVKALWYSKDEELPELPILPTELSCHDHTDQYEIKQFSKNIWGLLDLLTFREKHVLVSRILYEHTLEKIGESLNLTRERIRQIEAKAIRKLRGHWRLHNLADCVPDSIKHSDGWFDSYNKERQKKAIINSENVLIDVDFDPPKEFYCVYQLFEKEEEILNRFEIILKIIEYTFRNDFRMEMLDFLKTKDVRNVRKFIFITESAQKLAERLDKILQEQFKRFSLDFKRSTYQQTLNRN